jgi:hypothetical protein
VEDKKEKLTEEMASRSAIGLAKSLLGQAAKIGNVNPLRRGLAAGKYRITGTITRENGEAIVNVSIGMMGVESRTDHEGKFTLIVGKK